MRYIIIFLIGAIALAAFKWPKCEHAFTKVEQPEIQIKREGWVCSVYTPPPSGKQEGEELICVKCFHKQKQKIDYGQPNKRQSLSGFFDVNRGLFLNNESLVFDSVFLRPSAEGQKRIDSVVRSSLNIK